VARKTDRAKPRPARPQASSGPVKEGQGPKVGPPITRAVRWLGSDRRHPPPDPTGPAHRHWRARGEFRRSHDPDLGARVRSGVRVRRLRRPRRLPSALRPRFPRRPDNGHFGHDRPDHVLRWWDVLPALPAPDADPYAEVVTSGSRPDVCIIEAMKLMNEIESKCAEPSSRFSSRMRSRLGIWPRSCTWSSRPDRHGSVVRGERP